MTGGRGSEPGSIATVGYRIRGRVQGVGFRWWVQRQAHALGLTGQVRNCADGSVEIRARGSEDAIRALRGRLRTGPPMARVTDIESFVPAPVQESTFEIER
jgi:acylphosphatase